jgi:RNA polymerase sigma-70 factor, ECF subfamily
MGLARPESAGGERALLDAAQDGDEDAFRRLVEPHRRELHAHCYRMLGSVHDADDALQDALLRAWRGLPRFDGRSPARPWLYKIATNTSLDTIAKRPKRVLPLEYAPAADMHAGLGEPVAEPVWIEPYPDTALEDGFAAPDARYELRESVELAFVAAVQHLPATQRAVLLLREVLGFSAREVAEALETTVAAVNSLLQRARKTVEDKLPERSQQATLRALGDERLNGIVRGYMEAMERGDVETVVDMLVEDATWSMPPLAAWFHGEDAIRTFLIRGPLSGEWRWRHLAASASGQAAVGSYSWNPATERYEAFALDMLTLRGDRIAAITSFITRTAQPAADEDVQDYPLLAQDEGRLERVFARSGLPLSMT